MKLEITANLKDVTRFDLDINPWVAMISTGKKF
jgi:outer membrane protein W